MTVSSTTNRKSFTGDDVTVAFGTSPVVFFDSTDLEVYLVTTATGASVLQTLTTDYTVSGGAGSTGTVTMLTAPASTETLVILRVLPFTQTDDFLNNDINDAEVLEDRLDKLTMLTQQLDEVGARALKLGEAETASAALVELPFDRASKFLAFDASKNMMASEGTDTGVPTSAFMATVLDDTTAAAARGTLGLPTITANTTINVPADYSTIQAAFTYLAGVTIFPGVTVTIQVADGTLTLATGIDANHPQGSQIHLVGNETTPASCVIRGPNPPTFDALTVRNGHTLGKLNGFKFDVAAKAEAANNWTAILANNGSTIICGDKITVDNWYYGIAARNGSHIYCRSAVVSNAGDVGIWAFVGSSVDCRSAVVSAVSDAVSSLGFGIQAEYGSSIDCESASATTCKIGGIAALSGSVVRALSATSSSNTGSGFFCRDGGTIKAHGATANSNTRYGVEELTLGALYYTTITLNSNTIAARAPIARLNADNTLGARVDATSGDLRVDVNGADDIYFSTSGGAQFGITHTANAVNYWQATGAVTTGDPLLRVYSSTDTNVDGEIKAQGAGGHYFTNDNGNLLRLTDPGTGTQVNYIQMLSGATGAGPRILASGTDTDVDLRLFGQGAGLVRFGTHTGTADTATNGYITIKDAGGTSRKLATVA